ncbi:hypothetical protein P8452_43364 [Trifolium repens]|nr:hypothetical protein P8452_43364 [Trifolium repens]
MRTSTSLHSLSVNQYIKDGETLANGGTFEMSFFSPGNSKGRYLEHSLNLLRHAWRLWIENMPMELLDTHLLDMCISSDCIHVGLLCVQQKPEDRPDMSSVVLMLNGEKLLPQPKAPGFYTGNSSSETMSPSSNHMSTTSFVGR